MIASLLATLLLALIWGAVYKFALAPWMGLAATGAVLLLMLVRTFIRRRRARKAAAKKIEDDITAQAEEQARTVRPDLQPEVQAMKAEFSRAVASLKNSKLARGGRDALAVLPWYLMVGPPGTGKSTALRNSGLKFPYLSSKGGGAVRGVGGTRNCDWWLTNEAVFLDTAGRYTTGEEDRDEWMSFLDILARNRPSRPINGLIVTVSVTDLMNADPQAAGELGQRIRERVDEVTTRLKVVVPIYVMITKCDLINGFVEMFSDLPRSERGQIWGFTVPLSAQQEAPSELLLKRFDELTAVLEQRSIRRVGQERQLETRERIYQFPQRFDALRKSMVEFIQPLFMESVFQDTPVMRGLYFTSGTQDVRLSERQQVRGAAAEVFGSQRNAVEQTEGRSFFLWDVFNKVMFQDQKLAVRSSMEEMRLRKQRYTLTLAFLATAALVLLLPAVSYVENFELVRGVRDTITSVKLEATDDIGRVVELTPLQRQLEVLDQHQVKGPPFWLRMGMYQGGRLFPLAQSFYNDQLKGLLLGKQHARIKQDLQKFSELQERPEWAPSTDTYGRSFNDLKMYLLITQPRSIREPELDADHQSWLVWQIVTHWRNIRGQDRDTSVEEQIVQHAKMYIAMMARDPQQLGFVRDAEVVIKARRALNRVPLAELELQQLIADAAQEFPDLALGDMVGAVPEMRSGKKVRGAFTKRAWDDRLKRVLDESFRERQAWVLDRDSREEESNLRAELRTRYYQQYIEEWSDFLSSISVEEPQTIDQTERLLTSLTRGATPPLGRLFQAVTHNVQLEPLVEKGAEEKTPTTKERVMDFLMPDPRKGVLDFDDVVPGGVPQAPQYRPRNVADHFSGVSAFINKKFATNDKEEKLTQLDSYQDQLRLVLDTILVVRDKPGESGLLLEKIKTTRRDVEMLIKAQEGNQALFTRLLLPPLRDVRDIVFRDVSAKKSEQWCEEIVTPFMNVMGNRYPFAKDSEQDAPLSELSEFLRPANGQVKTFVKSQLQEDVILDGRRCSLALGSRDMYKEDLCRYLERLNSLSTALFPGDEVQPLVRFQIRIRAGTSPDTSASEIASIKFIMDGTEVLYRNGPDNIWQRLIWPGQAGELGATLQVVNIRGDMSELKEPGEWGLFRLLERVKNIEPSTDGRFFTATWEIQEFNGAQVSVDIRPERLAHPFFGAAGNTSMKLMQLFRDPKVLPPQGIALRGKGCQTLIANDTVR
ncbi:IcmF-related protein [Cystobacter fuscus DSM 2262]|uniref:IcmF-related protein n=1 Tax=Cystobacter fuscus (strain ATCC 25194 / DSM 2262 / NBRC 100088 / M29) TaxID=1242864 RepID=S9NZN5_CYSF2|nr:type VI secretion system membrane subunit TssM [Cystobacter fuscus]EPX55487.1 IcmF-related protein [Cystobacter fuscus DSM 2262]